MIVSNTTPISNLLQIDQIHLLVKLFGHVYIPVAVAEELKVVFSTSNVWRKMLDEGHIVIKKATNMLFINHMMPFLHRGEIETICLGLECSAKLCLMDDQDGRNVALKNKLSVTGTLGILLKAKRLGYLASVREHVDTLRREKHFWISKNMYQEVLRLAREKQKD